MASMERPSLGRALGLTRRAHTRCGWLRLRPSEASVTVVLRNHGPDPFRPDVYGAAIKIRRTLRADGTSHYALMSATGT